MSRTMLRLEEEAWKLCRSGVLDGESAIEALLAPQVAGLIGGGR